MSAKSGSPQEGRALEGRSLGTRRWLAVAALLVILAIAGSAVAEPPKWLAIIYNKEKQAVLMRFAPVAGATEYKVYRSQGKPDSFTLLTSTKTPQFFDESAEPAETYFYAFTAVTPAGESERSDQKSLLIPGEKRAKKLPAPVISKTVADARTLMGKVEASVTIAWTQERQAEATGFSVYRSDKEDGEYTQVGTLSATELGYSDKTVEVGKTYYYAVTALDSNLEETPRSAVASAKVEPPKAVAKKLPKMKSPIPRTTTVRWRVEPEVSDVDTVGKNKAKLRDPFDIVYDPATDLLYVDSVYYRHVAVFKGETGQFVKYLPLTWADTKVTQPVGMAMDPAGNLVVVDQKVGVVVMGTDGKLVKSIPIPKVEGAKDPNYIDVAVLPDGRMFVTDSVEAKVVVLDPSGKVVARWGVFGNEPGMFRSTGSILVTSDKNLAVADTIMGQVTILTPEGKFLKMFGQRKPLIDAFQFLNGIAQIDATDYLCTDVGSQMIKQWNPDGEPRQYIADLSNDDGTGRQAVTAPLNVAPDGKGGIFVVEGMVYRLSSWKLGEIIKPKE